MPEFDDQITPVSNVVPTTSLPAAETRHPWDILLENGLFIVTNTNVPSHAAALEDVLMRIKTAADTAPLAPVKLIEGWPDMTGFPPEAADVALWQKKVEVYHAQYRELLADAQAAFPTLAIQSLPLASALAILLESPAAQSLTYDQVFDAQSPEGTGQLTALTALLVQAALSDAPLLPADPPTGIPEEVAKIYPALATLAFELVGSTLAAPNDEDQSSGIINFLGTTENDVITLTAELNIIDGTEGIDTLVVDGLYDTAVVAFGAESEVLLRAEASPRAVTLLDVERIAFEDGTLAFDDDGIAGQAYRIYQACFDRIPDAEGLGFWIKQLDAGNVTLTEAADFFIGSEEFAEVYGAPQALADVHYLALLYANVLDRAPDTNGFGFWRNQQENGVTRADMLVYFSESTENVARVATAIDDGIWYI